MLEALIYESTDISEDQGGLANAAAASKPCSPQRPCPTPIFALNDVAAYVRG